MLPVLQMDIRRIFGANVRHYRLAARLSQEAVAERMGVDRAYISGIERGRQNATLLTLWHASQALGVRPVDLLDENVSKAKR
jgi:transcriptional regulator with XRE-family HTH domain